MLGYGKVNYSRNAMKLNFFLNVLNGDATNLLPWIRPASPLPFNFKSQTYDCSVTCARSSTDQRRQLRRQLPPQQLISSIAPCRR